MTEIEQKRKAIGRLVIGLSLACIVTLLYGLGYTGPYIKILLIASVIISACGAIKVK